MLDGLYPYEWILMVLGVILFFVLIRALSYQIKQKQSIAALLGFFMVSIGMIGYPSVKKIQVDNGVVSIEKTTESLQADPTDPAKRVQLQQQVEMLRRRPFSNAATLTTLSKAEFALGDEQSAKNNLKKALENKPDLPQARELQTKIAHLDQLVTLTDKVQSNPSDTAAKEQLQQTLKVVSEQPLANPSALLKVSQAQAAVGDYQKSAKTVQMVKTINPKLTMPLVHR